MTMRTAGEEKWQEALVEELATTRFYASGDRHLTVRGCLREAIRRTLEKAAAEPIDHLYSCANKPRIFVEGFEEGVRRYKAALRQLMGDK